MSNGHKFRALRRLVRALELSLVINDDMGTNSFYS